MIGNELDPEFCAELASNVYLIKDDFSRRGFEVKYKNTFNMEQSSMVKGKTGGVFFVKKSHVMAFMAIGQGLYKGQAFVAIKGTASLYDLLTDINTGVRSSHTGFPVHQGFYYAFDSILAELKQFISGLNGVSVVHCVGHSLGGAIATLAADWIKVSGGISTVKLYTFGSPRVGLENFANKCSSRLNSINTYRVYHRTDPVPMVPTWPFFHVPYTTVGYMIDSPVAIKPWEYHLMKHCIHSAKTAGSWKKIAKNRPMWHMDAAVERWLLSDSIQSFDANTLGLLDAALIYVMKKVINAAGIAVISAVGTGLTFLDRLAMLLAKAAKLTTDFSVWVFHLVKKMASLIGVTVKEGMDLTTEFIRKVFLHFHQKISALIWRIGQEVS